MTTSTSLKPIETRYNGYRFRSRLEARWAVFFDTAGIPYEYEKEGFQTEAGWYLPDFWLPQQKCWVEIKGGPLPKEDEHRIIDFVRHSEHPLFVFTGSIRDNALASYDRSEGEMSAEMYGARWEGWDTPYRWCRCTFCDELTIQYSGLYGFRHCDPNSRTLGREDTASDPMLVAAYDAAQAARFEHGEKGR